MEIDQLNWFVFNRYVNHFDFLYWPAKIALYAKMSNQLRCWKIVFLNKSECCCSAIIILYIALRYVVVNCREALWWLLIFVFYLYCIFFDLFINGWNNVLNHIENGSFTTKTLYPEHNEYWSVWTSHACARTCWWLFMDRNCLRLHDWMLHNRKEHTWYRKFLLLLLPLLHHHHSIGAPNNNRAINSKRKNLLIFHILLFNL